MIDVSKHVRLSGADAARLARDLCLKSAGFKFTARGNSMSPFIRDNHTITITPYGDTKPEAGDIAACINPLDGNLIVHRIILKKKNKFLIKGDNCSDDDGFFLNREIIGYVKKDYFLSKKLPNFMKKYKLNTKCDRALNSTIAFLSRSGFLKPILKLFRKIKSIFMQITLGVTSGNTCF